MAASLGRLRLAAPAALAALGLAAAASATWANRILADRDRPLPPLPEVTPIPLESLPALPAFRPESAGGEVARLANPRTEVGERSRVEVLLYTVQEGDAVFSIADRFGLKPETVLWGNYEVLNDDPHLLRPGQELNILPVDGTYYEWQAGDSLASVADFFGVEADAISDWPGNYLQSDTAPIEPGTWLIVPGGERAFRQWLVPTIARGAAGVGTAYGPGGCSGDYSGGAVGGGGFVWPTPNHYVSGNDYWAGHLGIDIAAGLGTRVGAADAGVIVFAGWSNGGYGNVVMIDHGNGWVTLYAHLSQVSVGCGQSVGQGAALGAAGSTGNSTGAHLHFETRFEGGWVNPWYVLP
jgi:murein DD-endopeptidase MepM/ murein hydrolase activator NlpD